MESHNPNVPKHQSVADVADVLILNGKIMMNIWPHFPNGGQTKMRENVPGLEIGKLAVAMFDYAWLVTNVDQEK